MAISDNVKRANEQKLRNGECIGRAPFGYKNITLPDGKKHVVLDDFLSKITIKAFELYSSGAYSLDLLRKKLKEDLGIDWSKSYLDKVFNNHFYYGVMVVKGKKYPHKYEPLITKELFDQVQAIKNGFMKKRFKYAGLPFIYRGLIRCGDCGLTITPERHKGYVYYHCIQYNGKHNAKWFKEEEITEQLQKIFMGFRMPDEVAANTLETLDSVHQQKVDFHNKQFDKFTGEQKSLTKMMDNLYLDKLKGKISDADYERFFESFKEQLDDINKRLSKLQEAQSNYYLTAKYVISIALRSHDLFTSSEVEGKRHLIKLVLQNLRISGHKLLCDVQKPFDLILECSDRQVWRSTQDYFRTNFMENINISYVMQTLSLS